MLPAARHPDHSCAPKQFIVPKLDCSLTMLDISGSGPATPAMTLIPCCNVLHWHAAAPLAAPTAHASTRPRPCRCSRKTHEQFSSAHTCRLGYTHMPHAVPAPSKQRGYPRVLPRVSPDPGNGRNSPNSILTTHSSPCQCRTHHHAPIAVCCHASRAVPRPVHAHHACRRRDLRTGSWRAGVKPHAWPACS